MKKLQVIILAALCFMQAYSVFAEPVIKGSDNNSEYTDIPQFNGTVSKNFTTRKYILGPNDVISISIYNIPEFNQKDIRIQPDGKIIITPLGIINVAGKTMDELHELLVDKYKYYIKDPQVSVALGTSRPFLVYVTGAIANPGSYEINTIVNQSPYFSKPESFVERKTPLLSNVLVAAGGLKFNADFEHIKVSNNIENSNYEVNLLRMVDKGDSSQDVYLMAGDTVYIPALPSPLAVSEEKYKKLASSTFVQQSVPVNVYGYVNNPGVVKLNPSESLTLNTAIMLAGGYLKDSAYAPKKVFVSRADNNGKLVTRVINPMSKDVILMPNDVVYIPEKAKPKVGKFFDYLARVASPFGTVANSYFNVDYAIKNK